MDEYKFRGQRPDEKVIIAIKQHIWLLAPVIYAWVVGVVLVIFAEKFFGASRVSSYTILIVLILELAFTCYRYFLWANGMYIVTNQRVVRISQLSLFHRQISEAEIDKIQEVTTEIVGPVKTMMNFGTVVIQTASSKGRMELVNMSDPYDVQQLIVGIQRENVKKRQGATGVNY